jgi:pilus assembly protein FimV
MNNFKRVSAVVLAGVTLLLASGSSHGLGFGRPSSRAILGDTLWLTVPVRLEPGEEIANDCLGADVYFGDDRVSASSVSAVVMSGSGSERVLRVSTTALINEPVVTVYLAAGCKARITRKFLALADPPGMAMPGTESSPVDVAGAIESATLPASSVVGKPSVLSAAVQGRRSPLSVDAASKSAKAAAAERATPATPLAGAPSMALAVAQSAAGKAPKAFERNEAAKRKPAAPTRNAKADAAESGGRLELDPMEADATVVPDLRMAPTLTTAVQADDTSPQVMARREAAAALWVALNATPEQMVRDRQRLNNLEQRLAQLKQESEAAHQAVATLKAQQAQAGGIDKWTALLFVIAVCGVVAAVFLYRQLRHQQKLSETWWQSKADPDMAEAEPPAEPDLGHTTAEFVHVPSVTLEPVVPAKPASAPEAPAHEWRGAAGTAAQRVLPDAPLAPVASSVSARVVNEPEPLREVSVEELIDLEQQAEFFVVLGQDDAAIDLLEGHVHSTTAASPLPFLKLMEIYRRVGKRADYERVQAEFNKRFNAHAPAWDSDFQHGHSLAEYPGVIERLQMLWSTPAKAMGVLEKSLTRPESGDDTFELPAYRELLFLYAVARDLSEREMQDRSTVDLLLPVMDASGDEPASSVHDAYVVEPLMATRPIKAHPEASPSISLDLHLDDIQVPEAKA